MHFYEILQDIMKEQSLSVPDVARMSGLADSTIRSIISRKTKTVALEVAFKISKGLNVSLERLNGDSYDNFYINEDEKEIIIAYRKHSEVQYAIKKLLDLNG